MGEVAITVNRQPPKRSVFNSQKFLHLAYPDSNFTARSSYTGNGKKEYIPLYALNLPLKVNHGPRVADRDKFVKRLIDGKIPERIRNSMREGDYHSSNKHVDFAKAYANELCDWVNSEVNYEAFPSTPTYAHGSWNYETVLLRNTHPTMFSVGTNNYVVQQGSVFLQKGNDGVGGTLLEPIFVMVTKKEYVREIRMLYMLNEPIPNNYFEMWVHPDFDTSNGKDSKWKSLRTFYRRNIKPVLETKGIAIIEKENIMNILFNLMELPKFTSPRQYKEWLLEVSNRFLNHKFKQQQGIDKERDQSKLISYNAVAVV